METDPYSLTGLRDIIVPDAPPFWPPAPGLWVALGVVFLLAFLVVWGIYARVQQNAYRKAGLQLLAEVKTIHDISVALKRVALAAFPREEVASLYGDAWTAFLHKTCPREDFQALLKVDAEIGADTNLIELASNWIRHHRVPGGQSPNRAN
jgi:hypothetical protein